jgi:hypothetical protein
MEKHFVTVHYMTFVAFIELIDAASVAEITWHE